MFCMFWYKNSIFWDKIPVFRDEFMNVLISSHGKL